MNELICELSLIMRGSNFNIKLVFKLAVFLSNLIEEIQAKILKTKQIAINYNDSDYNCLIQYNDCIVWNKVPSLIISI